jgi:hypothetical protein
MGGRRRLAGGFTPWLPDHRGQDGRAFRRYVSAALELVGPLNGSERTRAEVRRYAIAGVAYDPAAMAWGAAVAARERGRGRRPSARQVERAARRLGLAEQTLTAASARLEALAEENAQGQDLARANAALRLQALLRVAPRT